YEAAEALRRLNRVLAVLSDINQAIVRIRDPQALFDAACGIAVEKGHFSLAWIGLLDAASGAVKVAAHAGTAGDYLEKIHISLKDEPLGYCPINGVLRTGKCAVCNMIGMPDAQAPCRKTALDLGFRSAASFPLTVFGRIRGTMNLYADTPDHFDEEELKLLDEMAMDISFAMEFDEKEAERGRAEETLRESEQRYRSLFDNMLEGFAYCRMIYDGGTPQDFLYLDVNKAFATLTGLRDVVGKNVSEVIPGIRESNPELFEIYGRVVLTGRPERFEGYVAPLRTWFSVSAYSPEKDHFIAVFDNITERKEHETELEERVRSRTAELEFANGELEAFTYSVSHDLRAPLRAIEGFSQIIAEEYAGKIDAEADRLLNIISANTRRMDQLITDLLALSQISRSDMHFSPIDMAGLADSLYREIAPAEVLKTFAFSVASLPEAHGDPGLMRQVWSNLLSNAVKYTLPKDERRIEIGGYKNNGMD
ncbi:MAG: GAF domain-containing protein, partial [Proteobacteria bacterium]|nr:GAF domain-containing protein [Pseudomonadota bacterium]